MIYGPNSLCIRKWESPCWSPRWILEELQLVALLTALKLKSSSNHSLPLWRAAPRCCADCLYDTDTLTETRAPQTHREEAPREERAERTSLRYLKEVLEPERQRRQVQQVRHSEVHQVNSQLVPLLQLKGSVVQRVHVGRNANLQTQDHSPCSTSWSPVYQRSGNTS